MIQRRQFIGTLAAICSMPATSCFANSIATPERKLRWQCDVIPTIPHGYGRRAPVVTGVSLQPNGTQIAIVGDNHYVGIYETTQRRFLSHLGNHGDWVRTTKYSPDGQFLASAGNDRKLKIWKTKNFQERAQIYPHEHAIIDLAYSSDGRRLATVGFDTELRVYDMASGQIERKLRCHCDDNHTVAFSSDNQMVAVGGRSGSIRVWDINSGRQFIQFQPHKQRIRSIQFTGDNNIVSCGDDQMVKITAIETPDQPTTLPRHASKLFAVKLLTNGFLATSGSDNLIHIWNMDGAEELGVLKGHTGTVSSLDFSGNKIASGSFDTQVRLWHYQEGLDPIGRQTRNFDPSRNRKK